MSNQVKYFVFRVVFAALTCSVGLPVTNFAANGVKAKESGMWRQKIKRDVAADQITLNLLTSLSSALETSQIPTVASVQSLISQGADVTGRDASGLTPLHYAAAQSASICDLLIRNGANVNAANSNQVTPLFYAAKNGNIDAAKILLRSGVNVNATLRRIDGTGFEFTPLATAAVAKNNSYDLCRLFLKFGAYIPTIALNGAAAPFIQSPEITLNDKTKTMLDRSYKLNLFLLLNKFKADSFSPLEDLSVSNVQDLITSGAIVSATTNGDKINLAYNPAPLCLAIAYPDPRGSEMCAVLLNAGANVFNTTFPILLGASLFVTTATDLSSGDTYDLMTKVQSDLLNLKNAVSDPSLIQTLSEVTLPTIKTTGGASFTVFGATDNDGKTALHYAVQIGDLELCSALIEAGASLSVQDNTGTTPWHSWVLGWIYGDITTNARYAKIGEILKNADATAAGIADYEGTTPFHIAALQGNLGALSILFNTAVNANAADIRGDTPLHLAAGKGQTSACFMLIRILQSVKMYVDVQNVVGKTALHHAAATGNLDICKALIMAGASMTIIDDFGNTPAAIAKGDAVSAFNLTIDASSAASYANGFNVGQGVTATISADYALSSVGTITIEEGGKLVVAADKTFTNSGMLTNNGTLDNAGTINSDATGMIINNNIVNGMGTFTKPIKLSPYWVPYILSDVAITSSTDDVTAYANGFYVGSGGTATIDTAYFLGVGKTVAIEEGGTLNIGAGAAFTNNGIFINNGVVTNNGTVNFDDNGVVSGSGVMTGNDSVIVNPATPQIVIPQITTDFAIDSADLAVNYADGFSVASGQIATIRVSYTLNAEKSITVEEGGVLAVVSGGSVNVSSGGVIAIRKNGMLYVDNGGSINCSGNITNDGSLINYNSGFCAFNTGSGLINTSSGHITNNGTVYLYAGSTFVNEGTMAGGSDRFDTDFAINSTGQASFYAHGFSIAKDCKVTLNYDYVLNDGKSIALGHGAVLKIADGVTLTNNGSILPPDGMFLSITQN